MIEEKNIKNIPFDESNYQLIEYTDTIVLDQNKKVKVQDSGQKFAAIASFFYEYIKEFNIPCAYVKMHGKNSLVFVKYERFPFEVKILNSADKRISKIFSVKEGHLLNLPIYEYHYGTSKYSCISESHLTSFDLCTIEDIKSINRICSKVNAVIKSFFERRNEKIGEFTCTFGKFESKVYLIDGFTPINLKVLPIEQNGKWQDPYNLITALHIKKYTEHLFKITSG